MGDCGSDGVEPFLFFVPFMPIPSQRIEECGQWSDPTQDRWNVQHASSRNIYYTLCFSNSRCPTPQRATLACTISIGNTRGVPVRDSWSRPRSIIALSRHLASGHEGCECGERPEERGSVLGGSFVAVSALCFGELQAPQPGEGFRSCGLVGLGHHSSTIAGWTAELPAAFGGIR